MNVRKSFVWAIRAILTVTAVAVGVTSSAVAVYADDGSLRILVVGDSISVGCDASPPTSWCGELSALLTARGVEHTFGAHAIAGWSCTALRQGFAQRFDALQPDVVIMNCGTNDVPLTAAAQNAMGESWRSMVEYSWTHGARILPVFVQYSEAEINAEAGRGWLIPGEGAANDVIYVNMQYYIGEGWFAGLADLQKVPGTRDYLIGGSDGIHPNEWGNKVYAKIFYRALRGYYGWPDTVPEPCGMWGHRTVYDPPAYAQCVVMS